MINSLLDGYCRLMNELLLLREAEGGELPVEVESSYVQRLDDLWWRLSEQEQELYESELADTLTGPDDLHLIDCEVDQGSNTAPRKAA
jgi:hypothetical protein